ncbi:MAG: hypothetical protein NTV52_12245 [Acidobacteria bacterium]|nr:hypothetical protein [Acidobacteriota bacterium]
MVRLVCWNEGEAAEKAGWLRRLGFTVEAGPVNTGRLVTQFAGSGATVLLIDLNRLPAQGREVGVRLRQGKATRGMALVFAGGAADKVARVKQELPDAVYCSWEEVGTVLPEAKPGTAAVVGHMERYVGTPVAKKLGVKDGMKVVFQGEAPAGFAELLGEVEIGKRGEMLFWFVREKRELEWFPVCKTLWVIFRKGGDFNQNHVRLGGLAVGMVDYKICAVDAEWSGMKFAVKKTGSPIEAPSSR